MGISNRWRYEKRDIVFTGAVVSHWWGFQVIFQAAKVRTMKVFGHDHTVGEEALAARTIPRFTRPKTEWIRQKMKEIEDSVFLFEDAFVEKKPNITPLNGRSQESLEKGPFAKDNEQKGDK